MFSAKVSVVVFLTFWCGFLTGIGSTHFFREINGGKVVIQVQKPSEFTLSLTPEDGILPLVSEPVPVTKKAKAKPVKKQAKPYVDNQLARR